MQPRSDLRTPYQFFGTRDPKDGRSANDLQDWYQKELGHTDTKVWLSIDEVKGSQIALQYSTMLATRANEAKFSHRGKGYFFREDDVYAPNDETRCSSTYFELERAPNPDVR